MGRWMLHVVDGCTVTYTNIHNTSLEAQQTISINNCGAIYACWFAFENESVCFYYKFSNDIPAEPSELLYLVSMSVQEGMWVLYSPESVFTDRQYPGTISSSVDLYGMIDDESDSKGAVFLIGKGQNVHRVELLFLPVPVEQRLVRVCEQHHRVIQVVTTMHDMIIVCDNNMYWIIIDHWVPVKVTPQELTEVTLTGTSVNAYISVSSGTSIGLVAVNNANNTNYCFIGQPSQQPLSRCGVISNVSLSHGLLITRNNILDTQLLALFDEDIIGVINMSSSNSYETIDTDFCYQNNCLLVQTENMIYIDNEQKTMVLDRETFRVIATHNAGVYEVLPMMESAARQHTDLPSPSPTSTNTLTLTMVGNVTSLTIQTTTSTSVTAKTINIFSTFALKSITVSTTMASTSTDVTSTSIIDMDTFSTSDMKSINTDVTADAATTTTSEPSETNAVESPSGVNNTINNVTDPDTRSGSGTESPSGMLVIFITVISVLTLLILLLVMGLLAGKYYNVKRSRVCSSKRGLQEIPQTEAQQSESEAGKTRSKSEMVMPLHETEIYLPLFTNTSSKTTKITTMLETTHSVNTEERKILVK